jgi:hypothetical protein
VADRDDYARSLAEEYFSGRMYATRTDVAALRALIARVRSDTYETVARMAEADHAHADVARFAARIRALKEKPPG